MKSRFTILLLTGTILVFTVFSGTVLAEEAVKSDTKYTIPAELSPVWKWKDGYSDEEILYFRRAYTGESAQLQDDIGFYASRNLAEVLPCATIHRDGTVAILESAPMPELADVVATTILGARICTRNREAGVSKKVKGAEICQRIIGMIKDVSILRVAAARRPCLSA